MKGKSSNIPLEWEQIKMSRLPKKKTSEKSSYQSFVDQKDFQRGFQAERFALACSIDSTDCELDLKNISILLAFY